MQKKLTLTLNAAEKHTQFLFSCEEQGILCAQDCTQGKASVEFLIPAIAMACQKNSINITDIGRIAGVVGPGNFMGIRLIAVTVAGLIRSLSKDCLQAPLDYMQCVATNISLLFQEAFLRGDLEGKVVRVLTCATKDSVHICDYTFNTDFIPMQNFPTTLYSLQNKDFLHMSSNKPDFLIGSALNVHGDYFKKVYPNALFITPENIEKDNCQKNITSSELEHIDNPCMQALYAMTKHVSKQNLWQKADIIPLYLKKCDALQNLDSIAMQQGRKPEHAHEELKRLMNVRL